MGYSFLGFGLRFLFRAVNSQKNGTQWTANAAFGPLSIKEANLNGPQIPFPGRYPFKKRISMARKSRFRTVIPSKSESHWPANPVSGPLSLQKVNLIGPQMPLPGRYPSKKRILMARKSGFRTVIPSKSESHWPANPIPIQFTLAFCIRIKLTRKHPSQANQKNGCTMHPP
ncbi:hypothetical protein ACQCVP_14395 [Rossellomorea vietnamensis]|uniref:hypothetical protein n=1 Tax=Rossellomorea vietnamensis TaxID=218284 RepID=UPI003CED1F65